MVNGISPTYGAQVIDEKLRTIFRERDWNEMFTFFRVGDYFMR